MTTVANGHKVDRHIQDRPVFRDIMGQPSHRIKAKVIDHVDGLARRFIAASPFAVLATRRSEGGVDVTPRGDPAGFAKVLDDKTIALPERTGNRRADALENILDDPCVGLIFMIPGHNDMLRVSGTASIVQCEQLAARMAVENHTPDLIIFIRVDRLLCHCSKAVIRSSLWNSDEWPDRSEVPSLAEMMVAHGELVDTIEEMDSMIVKDRQTRLYSGR